MLGFTTQVHIYPIDCPYEVREMGPKVFALCGIRFDSVVVVDIPVEPRYVRQTV